MDCRPMGGIGWDKSETRRHEKASSSHNDEAGGAFRHLLQNTQQDRKLSGLGSLLHDL